ncbi:MAG: hypothetical protein ACYSWS_05790 [Planctomycetota bacterium]|jgi:hypothetical protein
MKKLLVLLACVVGIYLITISGYATPIVHTSDFINDGTRTNFNGFEQIGTVLYDVSTLGPYVENSIIVNQTNPSSFIWTQYNDTHRTGTFQ